MTFSGEELLYGLILMVVLGPAVGNYATSVVYRLPIRQTPFEKHPYCGSCGNFLQPRDLFPILSYCLNKGQCRFCGFKIRFGYTAIEILCGFIFVLGFLKYGVGEDFILTTTIGVFLVILVFLEYYQGWISDSILTYSILFGALWRVLHEGSIYPCFYSGFIMLMVSLVIWKLADTLARDKRPIPNYVGYALLMGVCLPFAPLAFALGIALVFYTLQIILTKCRTQGFAPCFGLYLMLLDPNLEVIKSFLAFTRH